MAQVKSMVQSMVEDMMDSIMCGVTAAFSPADLLLTLWLKLDVLARTAWNTALNQLNNSGIGVGMGGTLASGVVIEFVPANSDYIKLPNVGLNGVSEITKYAWIKTINSLSSQVILDIELGNDNGFYILGTANLEARLQFVSGGQKIIEIETSTNIADGEWHLVLMTYDGSNFTTYLDGVVSGTPQSISGDTISHNHVSNIGSRYLSVYNRTFDGQIGKVGFFNKGFTAAQALELYNNPQLHIPTGITFSTDVVGIWLLAESEGVDDPSILDIGPNEYHAQFSTSAASPYSSWVKGITAGFQTELSNFNRYGTTVGTGTVSIVVTDIMGVGTAFITEYKVNDVINVGIEFGRITSIADNENMVVAVAMTNVSAQPHRRYNLGDSGTLGVQNIFGTDHDSSTDIFGNTIVNIRPNDIGLNLVGGNHKASNFGINLDTSGDFSLLIPVQLDDYSTSQILFDNKRNGNGVGISVASNRFEYRITNGVTLTLTSNATLIAGTKYYAGFIQKSDGNTEIFFGTNSTDFVSQSTETDLGTPIAGSQDLGIGGRSDGEGSLIAGLIPGEIYAKESILTLQNFKDLIDYNETLIA